MPQYIVRKLKIGKTSQLDELARAAGELYSRTLVSFWRTVRKKDVWLSGYTMERWQVSDQLHAHTSDAITQSFYASLKSWRSRRKTDPNSKPPRRRRWFYKVLWKSSAIKLKDGKLRLSNGKGNQPLILDWQWSEPKQVELGWNKGSKCYELRACYAALPAVRPRVLKDTAPHIGERRLPRIVWGKGTRTKREKSKIRRLTSEDARIFR